MKIFCVLTLVLFSLAVLAQPSCGPCDSGPPDTRNSLQVTMGAIPHDAPLPGLIPDLLKQTGENNIMRLASHRQGDQSPAPILPVQDQERRAPEPEIKIMALAEAGSRLQITPSEPRS